MSGLPLCLVGGCNNFSGKNSRHGFCSGHYSFVRLGVDPFSKVVPVRPGCLFGDCEFQAASKGLCSKHYQAVRRGSLPAPEGSDVVLNRMCFFFECRNRAHNYSGSYCLEHHYQWTRCEVLTPINGHHEVICSVGSCEEISVSKSLCVKHYGRLQAGWAVLDNVCSADGCEVEASGEFCTACYWESRRVECIVPFCSNSTAGERGVCSSCAGRLVESGLSVDEFVRLRGISECEVCGKAKPERRSLAIDYDHSHHDGPSRMCPDCIRGVLCSGCNSALGHAGDSPDILRKLANYLEEFEARKIY